MLVLNFLRVHFFIMIAAVSTSGFNGIRVAPYATLSDAVIALLVGIWVLSFPLLRHAKLRWSVVSSLFMFCLAFVASSLFGTSEMGVPTDLVKLAKVLSTFFFLPYLVSDIARTDRRVRAVMVAFVASAVLNVTVALLDAGGVTDFQNWLHVETVHGWGYETRFHGLTMHPNHFGLMCAIAAALALGAFPLTRSRWALGAWAGSEILLIVGVLGSGSRAALLAVVVMSFVLFLKYRRSLGLTLSKLAILAGIVAASAGAFHYVGEATVTHGAFARLVGDVPSVEDSNSARLRDYVGAAVDFASSPLVGVGFSYMGGVENLALQFLQSGGVLGLAGIVIYFWPVAIAWVRLRGRHPDYLMIAAISGIGVYLLFTLVVNLSYARFSLIPVGLLWALLRRSRIMPVVEVRNFRKQPPPYYRRLVSSDHHVE